MIKTVSDGHLLKVMVKDPEESVSFPKPDFVNWIVANGISSSLWVSFTIPRRVLTWARDAVLRMDSRMATHNLMPFKFMAAKIRKDWRIRVLANSELRLPDAGNINKLLRQIPALQGQHGPHTICRSVFQYHGSAFPGQHRHIIIVIEYREYAFFCHRINH